MANFIIVIICMSVKIINLEPSLSILIKNLSNALVSIDILKSTFAKKKS